jgi:sodium/proline symporter
VAASRKMNDLRDYYAGGKRFGFWAAAFSSRATGESAWLLIGLTGMGAAVGAQALWVVLGEVLGVAAAWIFLCRRFKGLTDRYDSITIPDYLESRLRDSGHRIRLVAAFTLVVFVTIYVSAQIDATGKAFESFLEWDYFAGAVFGFAIVVIYTLSGGFVAVAWSDLFQGLLMLVGLVLLPIAALVSMPAGESVWSGLEQRQTGLTSLWGPGGPSLENVLIIVSYLAIGLGFLGSPQVFVRFMSIRNEGEILAGRWVAIVFTLLTDGGAVLAGMFGRYLMTPVGAGPEALFGDAGPLGPGGENILPLMVNHLFPSLVVGLYIAAVLAATMSTIDSLLVVASSAVVRDAYQQTFARHANTATLTGLSRWVTLGMSLAALALALTIAWLVPERTIFWFVIFGFSGIAATFCPVIVLSLCWRRYNVFGALASMLTGFTCIPTFKFAMPLIPVAGPYVSLVEEMAPSFVLALVAVVVATIVTSGKKKVEENEG